MPSHPHESDPTGEPACRELAAGQELAAVGPAHPDDEDTPTTGGSPPSTRRASAVTGVALFALSLIHI